MKEQNGPSEPPDGKMPAAAIADQTDNDGIAREFVIERYKFILQQIHVVNENLYRFFAIYQTLLTALIGAQLILFVNWRRWEVSPVTCRSAILGLTALISVVASFAMLWIIVGLLAWLDYRNEECDLTDSIVGIGFRSRPKRSNWWRWYETYVAFFVIASVGLAWGLTLGVLMPAIH